MTTDSIKDNLKDTKSKGHMSFMVQKVELISSAIYLMSDLLSHRESIRWELRKQAMHILSDIQLLSDSDARVRETAKVHVVQRIDRLVALLLMGTRVGLFSEMNRSVVTSELAGVRAFIGVEGAHGVESAQTVEFGMDHFAPDMSRGRSSVKPRDTRSPRAVSSDTSRVPREGGTSTAERYARIMAFLGGHESSTLASLIAGTVLGAQVSVKTVQRDLAELVRNGLVAQVGTRRWSQYKLTQKGQFEALQKDKPEGGVSA